MEGEEEQYAHPGTQSLMVIEITRAHENPSFYLSQRHRTQNWGSLTLSSLSHHQTIIRVPFHPLTKAAQGHCICIYVEQVHQEKSLSKQIFFFLSN